MTSIETDAEDLTDGVLRSAGLSSGVVDADEDHVGHVLMADYDGDTDPLTMRDETDLPGLNVLLESSPGSYHYYNLSVRPLEEQLVKALRLHGDAEHVRQSARRSYFVLRWTGKVHEDGTRYKEPPTLYDVWTVDGADVPQSLPHLQAVRQRAEEDGATDAVGTLERAAQEYETVGERCILSKYMTMTDDLKAEVAGDGR